MIRLQHYGPCRHQFLERNVHQVPSKFHMELHCAFCGHLYPSPLTETLWSHLFLGCFSPPPVGGEYLQYLLVRVIFWPSPERAKVCSHSGHRSLFCARLAEAAGTSALAGRGVGGHLPLPPAESPVWEQTLCSYSLMLNGVLWYGWHAEHVNAVLQSGIFLFFHFTCANPPYILGRGEAIGRSVLSSTRFFCVTLCNC